MILRNEATGEVITKPCVPNWKWNTGTDENPLDSFGRPFHRLPSMAEYQMAKKEFEYQETLDTIKAIKELKKELKKEL